MPAYEYLCDSCETHFEKRQKMSEAPMESCPECGGRVRRLISGGAGAITRGASNASSYAPPQCSMGGGPCCGSACMGEGNGCES